MKNTITKSKLEKYYRITSRAFEVAKNSVTREKKEKAREILLMVSCYLEDSKYFKEKKDYVNSFACLNYAHGWLDSGARLKIFKVNDNKLFSV